MLKPLLAFAALLTAGAIVVPTVSQAAGMDWDTRSVSVSYADLDLVSLESRDVLERRISRAANTVCNLAASNSLALDSEMRSCRDGALAGARPQFEAAVAAALHPSVTVGSAAALVVTGQRA
jgi:UrcA family protein